MSADERMPLRFFAPVELAPKTPLLTPAQAAVIAAVEHMMMQATIHASGGKLAGWQTIDKDDMRAVMEAGYNAFVVPHVEKCKADTLRAQEGE